MGGGVGTGKIAIQRGELATREMDVMAALINCLAHSTDALSTGCCKP